LENKEIMSIIQNGAECIRESKLRVCPMMKVVKVDPRISDKGQPVFVLGYSFLADFQERFRILLAYSCPHNIILVQIFPKRFCFL